MKKAINGIFIAALTLALLGACGSARAGMLSKEDHKEPVVLVHGYFGSVLGMASVDVYWGYYITRLKIDGYDVSWIALPDGALGDVKVSAQALSSFIDGVLARTGKSKVDIICHSEGGLVSRYYIKNLGGVNKVDDLVFLSTPHRGTTVASIGPGEAARQMEVGSSFIADLDSDPYLPGEIDYTAIFSNHDEIVVPQENAFLRGAVNMNVNLLGHGGIMFNEFVYQMAKTAIDTDIADGHDAIPVEIVKDKMTTNKGTVTLKLKKFNHYDWDASVRKMKVSGNQYLLSGDWEDFSDTKTWNLDTSSDGLKAVYVKFKDGSNFLMPKESPTYVDYIFYDSHAPTGSVNVGPDATTETTVPVHIDASDNSDNYKKLNGWNILTAYGISDLGVKEMIVSTSADFAGASWQPFAVDTTVNLGAGSGVRTVYVKLRDGAGNESGAITDTVRVIDPNAGDIGMISESGKQPVVLVHGYMGSIAGDVSAYINWVYIYEKLKADGFDVYRIALSDAGLQDVKKSAAELQAFVSDVLSKTGASKVDVVCHSEGGLVARYYIKNLGGRAYVNDLVTISTPHRGTTVASIGPGEAARQMEVASSFLRELNSGETLPGDLEYTALFSHGDEVVVPGKNGFYDGAVNINYVIYGHAGILFSPEVYTAVKNALAYKYLFAKGVRPVEIKQPLMVTKSNTLELALRPCNHYAPTTPVTQMMVSTDPLFAGASWQAVSQTAVVSVAGKSEGLLGVHVKFRGADGVESPSYADYIVLDRTAPSGSIAVAATPAAGETKLTLNISVSDNADKYGEFKVTNLTEAYGILGIGATEMMIGNSADFAGAAWEQVAATKEWNVTSGAGNKTVYAKFRDAAGNESAAVSVSLYVFDRVNGFMAQEAGKDPVVFVHGYMGSIVGDVSSYLNWVYYVEKMKAEGYKTYVITLSEAGMQDVTVSAGELASFVQKVLAETGATQVDLVCHSEGGLVARYYVQFLGGSGTVDDLITISTPHRGTSVASIGPGEASRQMEIGSDFLKLLNEKNNLIGTVDYTAIFSNDDTTIYPPENAFYAGALNIATNGYNHATILFNDEVYKYVISALSLDIGHGIDQIPVYIKKTSMVTPDLNVVLKINYYNHNAPEYPAGEMMISNDKNFAGATWRAPADNVNWTLDGDDGLKAVYVKFRSADTNTESAVYVDYIVLDRTAPAGAVIATPTSDGAAADLVIMAADNSDTYTRLNLLQLDKSYGILGVGLKDMMVWNTDDFVGAIWESYAAKKQWTLPSGDGAKKVYVKFRDAAGNESVVVSAEVVNPVAAVETAVEDAATEIAETVEETIADITSDLSLEGGWNLIYVPDGLVDSVRTQIAGLFDSGSTVFDIAGKDYMNVSEAWSVRGGRSFWQNLNSPLTNRLTFKAKVAKAAASSLRSVALDKGWNVIGIGTYEPLAVSQITFTVGTETIDMQTMVSRGWVNGKVLAYTGGKYEQTDSLQPFHAYLIKVYQPCVINLP